MDFRGAEADYTADKTRLKVETSRERMLSALIPRTLAHHQQPIHKSVRRGTDSVVGCILSRQKNWREKSKLSTREPKELLDSATRLLQFNINGMWMPKMHHFVCREVERQSASFTPVLLDRWTYEKKTHVSVYIVRSGSGFYLWEQIQN